MKRVLILLTFICASTSYAKPAPGVSGTLSIIPGLGQVSNGDTGEGLVWFSSVVGLSLTGNRYAGQAAFDLWMYNMYDAYRDAGARDTTKYNLFQNWISPFNPLNIIDPIGAPYIGITALSKSPKNSISGPRNRLFAVPFFSMVAGGEEALFRGFLYPGFSHLTQSRIIGAIISSAAFSTFHLINRTAFDSSAGALGMRFVMGMLFCWQLTLNKYDMRKGIFAHAWIDTIVDWKGGGSDASVAPKLNLQLKF